MADVGARLRMGLIIVGSVYTSVYIYGLYYDSFVSCLDPQARWNQLVMVDFYVNMIAIWAWVFYKEDFSLLKKIATVLIGITGSIFVCSYLVMQFSKLSPKESSKDPLYFVLARRQKANKTEQKRSCSPASARALFGALGSFMLGYNIYTYIVDGSPFRKEVLSMCMAGNLVDLYILKGIISVWVTYKESSPKSAFMWRLILICFSSVGTCAYLVLQLSCLSPHQDVYDVLFVDNKRDMHSTDRLLSNGKKLT